MQPILHPREVELEQPVVRDYMRIDEYRYYVEDAEVCWLCGSVVEEVLLLL